MNYLHSLWQTGFRPFFLLAGVFASLSIFLWMGMYGFSLQILPLDMPMMTWHAHEMIYGYTMAVVAGFLLTAVRNWTKRDTLQGGGLKLVVGLWCLARLSFFIGAVPIWVSGVLDGLFLVGLLIGVGRPIIQSKNWRNAGVLAKVFIFLILNTVFYLGMMGLVPHGVRIGLYGGLYLIIALIVTIGRRVIPFFTERGVDGDVTPHNWRWVDRSSLIFFVAFYISVLMNPYSIYVGRLAVVLACLYSVRLWGWYTPLIWKKPLLWVLHGAYAAIILGFILTATSIFLGTSAYLAIHAFSYGGIGLSTIGMMSRVSLGHTGRDIHAPSKWIVVCFFSVCLGLVVRCILPIVWPGHYLIWMVISQCLWGVAFALFVCVYGAILIGPRADGKPG